MATTPRHHLQSALVNHIGEKPKHSIVKGPCFACIRKRSQVAMVGPTDDSKCSCNIRGTTLLDAVGNFDLPQFLDHS